MQEWRDCTCNGRPQQGPLHSTSSLPLAWSFSRSSSGRGGTGPTRGCDLRQLPGFSKDGIPYQCDTEIHRKEVLQFFPSLSAPTRLFLYFYRCHRREYTLCCAAFAYRRERVPSFRVQRNNKEDFLGPFLLRRRPLLGAHGDGGDPPTGESGPKPSRHRCISRGKAEACR